MTLVTTDEFASWGISHRRIPRKKCGTVQSYHFPTRRKIETMPNTWPRRRILELQVMLEICQRSSSYPPLGRIYTFYSIWLYGDLSQSAFKIGDRDSWSEEHVLKCFEDGDRGRYRNIILFHMIERWRWVPRFHHLW